VGGLEELHEVVKSSVLGEDRIEVGDVVAAIAQRRLEERQEPDAVDAQPFQVIELLDQPSEVSEPVGVRVDEASDVQLIEKSRLVPLRIAFHSGL
jgi:hypothetical protein